MNTHHHRSGPTASRRVRPSTACQSKLLAWAPLRSALTFRFASLNQLVLHHKRLNPDTVAALAEPIGDGWRGLRLREALAERSLEALQEGAGPQGREQLGWKEAHPEPDPGPGIRTYWQFSQYEDSIG
jgi:hypothetical protein